MTHRKLGSNPSNEPTVVDELSRNVMNAYEATCPAKTATLARNKDKLSQAEDRPLSTLKLSAPGIDFSKRVVSCTDRENFEMVKEAISDAMSCLWLTARGICCFFYFPHTKHYNTNQ